MSSDFMPQALDSLLASQRASVYGSSKTGSSDNSWMEDYEIHQKGEDMGLDFTDYLQLMVQQLQNQTMDNTTDTSDMLNQLVQMSVVQMMTTVKTSIDTLVDANTLTYAASLVGKTVTVGEYGEDGKPARLEAVVLSTQHDENVTQEQIHEDIKKYVFDEILPQEMVDADTKFFINPTGRFVIGGPHGDSGLTGRKIIVDTYGGYARHGGGAFSGKDCTKVDRSAAYAARYVAKNLVAAGIADRCEIQLSYAIGVALPTSIRVETFGTGKLSEDKIVEIIRENFDLRPAGIIRMLDLRRPIYKQTAAYGHFGRNDLDLPWERLDKVETLKKYL